MAYPYAGKVISLGQARTILDCRFWIDGAQRGDVASANTPNPTSKIANPKWSYACCRGNGGRTRRAYFGPLDWGAVRLAAPRSIRSALRRRASTIARLSGGSANQTY